MSTKGVVACALGGAIISTTLLGSWLTTEVEARTASEKTDERPVHSRKGQKREAKNREIATEPKNPQRATERRISAKDNRTRLGKFSVTAYSYYRNSRGGLSKTATGVPPRAGRTVAVDPRIIPLGSRIYIEGVGERIAEDTGGKVKGKKLDLFLPSVQDCIQFGRRQHEVHILAQE